MPGLFELVYFYERQQALLLSYSPTEAGSAGVSALGLYPGSVRLFFSGGDRLEDPHGLLQGQAKTVRFVVMNSAAEFDRPELEALMRAALSLAKVRVRPGVEGETLLRAESQKQRARRATTSRAK